MKKRKIAVVLAAALFHAGIAHAQRIELALFAGTARVSQLGDVEGRLPPTGGGTAPTRFVFDFGPEPAPVFGLALATEVRPGTTARLTGTFSTTEVELEGAVVDPGGIQDLAPLGGLGRLYVSTIDFALVRHLAPRRRAIVPFVQLGAGAAVYDLNDPGDFEIVESLTRVRLGSAAGTRVTPMVALGLGADVRLGRGPFLRLEATHRIGGGPFSDFDLDTGAEFSGITDGAEVVHGFQLTMGVVAPIR